jgi:hypothetical protein
VNEENYLIKKSTLALMADTLRERGQIQFNPEEETTPYDLIKYMTRP